MYNGLRTSAQTLVVGSLLTIALYLPDYVLNFSQREPEFQVFLLWFLIGLVLLIALVAGTLKALSSQRWIIRPDTGVVEWFSRTATGRHIEEHLDLDQVDELRVELSKRFYQLTIVRLLLIDGTSVIIAKGPAAEMSAMTDRLRRVLSAYREHQRAR